MQKFIKRHRAVVIAALVPIAALTSCSDSLSRREAKKELKKCLKEDERKLGISDTCTYSIRRSFVSDYGRTSYFCAVIMDQKISEEDRWFIDHGTQNGLLTIRQEQVNKGCAYWTINHVELTEKGKQYLVRDNGGPYVIWTAVFTIGEVTGIREEKERNRSLVEYHIEKTEMSPFGEFWQKNCFDNEKTYKANFNKYDDGWRL